MYRILITGSRHWSNKPVVAQAIRQAWLDAGKPHGVTVVHGGATGADYIAGVYAKRLGFTVEVHEADWSKGKRGGPERNQKMVDLGADICLAFPLPDSTGTLDCMNKAAQAGIPVVVFKDN